MKSCWCNVFKVDTWRNVGCQYGVFHQSKKAQLTTSQSALLALSDRSHQQQKQRDTRDHHSDTKTSLSGHSEASCLTRDTELIMKHHQSDATTTSRPTSRSLSSSHLKAAFISTRIRCLASDRSGPSDCVQLRNASQLLDYPQQSPCHSAQIAKPHSIGRRLRFDVGAIPTLKESFSIGMAPTSNRSESKVLQTHI